MRKVLYLGLLAAFILSACQQSRSVAAAKQDDAKNVGGQQFGAPITSADAITYDELLSKNIQAPTTLKVKGRVSEVCQAKGCWMNIVSDKNQQASTMKVRFKDYAFFMPKDISGREVIVEGEASVQVISVDDLRHYAEDAGKTQEEINAITQPRRELTFLASGVILLDK